LKKRFHAAISASRAKAPAPVDPPLIASSPSTGGLFDSDGGYAGVDASHEIAKNDAPEDVLGTYSKAAIATVAQNNAIIDRIKTGGMTWKGIMDVLEHALPDVLDERGKIAYDLVRQFMNEVFGEGKWRTERRQSKSGPGMTTWVVLK
jgi:hypothetical protein